MLPIQAQTPTPARVLIIDDQPAVLHSLELLLHVEGFLTEALASPEAVLQALACRQYDLLLMDLNYTRDTTSGAEGLDLLERVRAIDPTLPIVAMTGWGTVEVAVEAMRRGVRDFIQKPWQNAQLVEIVRRETELGCERRRRLHEQQRDLLDARLVQERLLPAELPRLPGWDIAACWEPARGVVGDYFDAFVLDGNSLGLCIGDVVGRGVSAALLMANLQANVRALATPALAPGEVCARLNRTLCEHVPDGKFVTFFYGCLETSSRILTYVNAGHNRPILVHADGSSERLDRGGTVLGVFRDWEAEQGSARLSVGDRLVLFTDGVTEATTPDGDEFGDDRLVSLVVSERRLSAESLRARVVATLADLTRTAPQDDATVVVVAAEQERPALG